MYLNPFTWSDYLFINEKYQFYLCSLIFLLIFLTFVLNPWLVFKLRTIWQSDSEAVDKFLFNGLFQNLCLWANTSRKFCQQKFSRVRYYLALVTRWCCVIQGEHPFSINTSFLCTLQHILISLTVFIFKIVSISQPILAKSIKHY